MYAKKDLFGILAIASVNVINHVMFTIYIVLIVMIFTISIGIGAYFAYSR